MATFPNALTKDRNTMIRTTESMCCLPSETCISLYFACEREWCKERCAVPMHEPVSRRRQFCPNRIPICFPSDSAFVVMGAKDFVIVVGSLRWAYQSYLESISFGSMTGCRRSNHTMAHNDEVVEIFSH